nr:MAG TPA: hypothetical protein [Caudoviricetes sp.]
MKDKTQYEALMEELKKLANNFKDVVTELGDILAKILPDVEIPDEEEDTWEMKCPYEHGDTHYCIQPNGAVFADCWEGIESDNRYFSQGNVFPTEEAAELEAKRRNLLTRFRAFRDECNGDWEPNFSDDEEKYYLYYSILEECIDVGWIVLGCSFNIFGYFKNQEDAERAIELFGDEIIELYVEKRLANENN